MIGVDTLKWLFFNECVSSQLSAKLRSKRGLFLFDDCGVRRFGFQSSGCGLDFIIISIVYMMMHRVPDGPGEALWPRHESHQGLQK